MQIFAHIFAYMKPTKRPAPFEQVDALGSSFLGLQLYQLLTVIDVQGSEMLSQMEVEVPSRVASSLMILKMNGPMSVTELGTALNMTHQLMAHRVQLLKELKLINTKPDPKDKRKQLFHLTAKGKKLTEQLETVTKQAENAYADLFEELGADLYDLLIKARKALLRNPLHQRITTES